MRLPCLSNVFLHTITAHWAILKMYRVSFSGPEGVKNLP
jgi:hypothetical protein